MAIAFNSTVDGGATTATSLTFAFNNVAGNILFVGFLGDASTDDITGVTYNSVALTPINKIQGRRWTYLYVLSNPATTTNNVVISCTASHYITGGALSYSGANLTGQPDANTTQTSGSAVDTLTTSLSSVADNCWHMLVENGFDSQSVPGAGAGTTYRVSDGAFEEWGLFDSNSAKTPPGSVSLTTTYPGVTSAISHVMASFAPPPPAVLSMPKPIMQAVTRASYY
jgi:hypothetical protein